MKHLKLLENYLTKKGQPKETYDEYLYDFGFGDNFHVCGKCKSKRMTPTPSGAFSPPNWKCDDCGYDSGTSWRIERYEEYLVNKEAEKFNI